jgi:hypothetical protein
VINGPDQRAVFIRTSTSPDPAKLVIVGNTTLQNDEGVTIRLQDIQVGDTVRATGVPTPDKALVYLGNTLTDPNVEVVKDEIGFVTKWTSASRTLTVHISGRMMVTIPVKGSTEYVGPRRPNGQPNLAPGDVVGITGVINTRRRRVTGPARVQVYRLPR